MAKKSKKAGKKGIELDMLGWWIIALIVLVILVIGVIIFSQKGSGAMDFIRNLFRFKSAG
jgi:hypothetical protein